MDRLKEPSTWAGFAGIVGPIAAFLPGMAGMVVGGIAAACGGIAAYLREGSAHA